MEKVNAVDQIGVVDTSGTSGELESEQVKDVYPALDPDNVVENGEVIIQDRKVGVDIDGNVPEGENGEDGGEDEDRPAGNATTDEWHEYRLAHGYTEDELEEKGRDDLRDLKDR